MRSGCGPLTTAREALGRKGGVYCEDVDIAEQVPADFPEPRGVRPSATDPDLAERLRAKSRE